MNPTDAAAGIALNTLSRISRRLAAALTFALFHRPLARSKPRESERQLT